MFQIILSVITLLLNTGLGFLVFLRNTRSWSNRFFLLLALLINAYLVVNYISLHPPEIGAQQLFWIRMVMFVTSFIGPTLFMLVHTFPGVRVKLRKRYIFALCLLCITTALAALSPLVFSSIQYPNGKPVPIPGPAIPLFFFDFVGLFLTSIILLVVKYVKSQGFAKVQLFYFLFGVLMTFSVMGISTVIFVVILKQSDFVFLGPISALFLIGFIAYAIVKHRLLDIHLVVTRSIAYLFVILVLGGLYSFYILFIGSSVLKLNYGIRDYLFFGFAMFIVAFTFQPLRRLFEKHTDDLFYKGAYDSQKLLQFLSGIMSSSIALENLTSRILENVSLMMHIGRGVFVLLKSQDGSGAIEYVDAKGYEVSIPRFTKEEIQIFLAEQRIVLFDDLEEGPLKQAMRNLNLTIVLPLLVNEEKIGILGFGDKSSGDVYSQQDINVLKLLAPQLSVAVQNSREYEEIKRFNITLRDEVDKATKGLQAANEQLKELDKLKDEFVSVASHELRTPMTSIRSYLWMALKGQGGKLLEKQEFYVQRAYNSVDRLIKLVNDMLNVSRIESGRISLDMKQVELVGLFQEVVDDLLPHAKELGIALLLDKASGASAVMADPDKIREVVFNLIGNALKFTPSGGTITVSFVVKNGLVESRVSDTGAGIETDNLSHLFQKFGILPGSYTTNKSAMMGTGLGLYICKSIIELHGGLIWAESPGKSKGATFVFSLVEFSEEKLKEYLALHPSDQGEHMGLEHTQL